MAIGFGLPISHLGNWRIGVQRLPFIEQTLPPPAFEEAPINRMLWRLQHWFWQALSQRHINFRSQPFLTTKGPELEPLVTAVFNKPHKLMIAHQAPGYRKLIQAHNMARLFGIERKILRCVVPGISRHAYQPIAGWNQGIRLLWVGRHLTRRRTLKGCPGW